jgi:endogenous inhibitor of DNA gyrase (YacG/DUF329 family)
MTARTCPICKKPQTPAYAPFCSKRCADVDLQRWFSGAYAVPAVEDESDKDPQAEPDEVRASGQGRGRPL